MFRIMSDIYRKIIVILNILISQKICFKKIIFPLSTLSPRAGLCEEGSNYTQDRLGRILRLLRVLSRQWFKVPHSLLFFSHPTIFNTKYRGQRKYKDSVAYKSLKYVRYILYSTNVKYKKLALLF